MVRLYEFHDEVHYVVRQTDGSPLALPGWMTDPEAAYVNVVSRARLPLCVLRELRRMAVTQRSSSVHNVHEEDHDAAVPSKIPTTPVPRAVPAVRFPRDVQEPLRQALVQWLQAVAKRMREEAGDEQDHR